MLPEAYISHMISRRLRVRIPSRKGDVLFFGEMHKKLSCFDGIERVEVNALTGSVLLIHAVDLREIADFARQNNLFSILDTKIYRKQTYVSRKISETFRDINHKVIISTKGFANIPDLLVLTFLGLSIFQISRGNFMAPAWYTALWYAMNIFMKSQTKQAAE
jgi:hypothetical protein